MSRPKKKFSSGQIKLIGELAGLGMSIEQIADRLGICRKTFYNLQDEYPEIVTQYKKGKSEAIEQVLNVHYDQVNKPENHVERIFYLKTQAGMKETVVNENINEELKVTVKRDKR